MAAAAALAGTSAAWAALVGSAGSDNGGAWAAQVASLTALYASLERLKGHKPPAAVLAARGGAAPSAAAPEGSGVTTMVWRGICAGLQVKYDLPHVEDVEAERGVVCGGGAPSTAAEWAAVREQMRAQQRGGHGVAADVPRLQPPDMQGRGDALTPWGDALAQVTSSKDKMRAIEEAFAFLDSDKSGVLTYAEFVSVRDTKA